MVTGLPLRYNHSETGCFQNSACEFRLHYCCGQENPSCSALSSVRYCNIHFKRQEKEGCCKHSHPYVLLAFPLGESYLCCRTTELAVCIERTLLWFCTLKLCIISWAYDLFFKCHYGKKPTQINTSIAAAPRRQHPLTTLGVHTTQRQGFVFWKALEHLWG